MSHANGEQIIQHLEDEASKEHETPEEGYYILSSPERSVVQIKKIQGEMPKGEFTPAKQDWTRLSRTRRILSEGEDSRFHAPRSGEAPRPLELAETIGTNQPEKKGQLK